MQQKCQSVGESMSGRKEPSVTMPEAVADMKNCQQHRNRATGLILFLQLSRWLYSTRSSLLCRPSLWTRFELWRNHKTLVCTYHQSLSLMLLCGKRMKITYAVRSRNDTLPRSTHSTARSVFDVTERQFTANKPGGERTLSYNTVYVCTMCT